MFFSTNIQVDRHQVGSCRWNELWCVGRVEVAQKIPRRVDKRVHSVCLTSAIVTAVTPDITRSITQTTVLHCVSKNIPNVFSYNSQKHCRICIIYGKNITEKVSNQRCYIFPPHLINAPALPCETEKTKIVSIHVNVSRWFASRHTNHIGIIN